eukprot:7816910-Alexandrium_andersonii.AAC.1
MPLLEPVEDVAASSGQTCLPTDAGHPFEHLRLRSEKPGGATNCPELLEAAGKAPGRARLQSAAIRNPPCVKCLELREPRNGLKMGPRSS